MSEENEFYQVDVYTYTEPTKSFPPHGIEGYREYGELNKHDQKYLEKLRCNADSNFNMAVPEIYNELIKNASDIISNKSKSSDNQFFDNLKTRFSSNYTFDNLLTGDLDQILFMAGFPSPQCYQLTNMFLDFPDVEEDKEL